ncbi:hypothetical protein [Dyadobacter chenhuakuii]|uniref:Uncharacterized protein n=1 Tax=Dyadobacter chenhuakuii TaxID=2909339 RepID=A0ABY4XM13_9BACT|nr:hypothetical protein [Dyadobacter chenhuakuii]MCF2494299.1 hypothetical protein [Dyadobacter chenhuakuii]USJ31423.1 hypothetical protein NFI80_01515 [Dyadobacter chenhuakuii]
MKKNSPPLCPAFSGIKKSNLLGILQHDKIALLPNPLELDQDFIENLKNGSLPEQHFRFVSRCGTGECIQWKGQRCGVAAEVVNFVKSVKNDDIPDCSIRSDCRWYRQEGVSICKVCPYVLTDMKASELAIIFSNRGEDLLK